jgi:hypothetical protein
MKVCKTGKYWLNMNNFSNAVDEGDSVTIFFAGEDYIRLTGDNAQSLRDWLNEAHAKTEI